MRILPLAALLLAGPLSAQAVLHFGDVLELPSTTTGGADHATLAINNRGDVFLAWQATRPDLSGSFPIRQVEGVYLERTGKFTWRVPTLSDVLVLGDPSLGLLGSQETCRKPDVVAVGLDFVVVFPRNIPDGAPGGGTAQLEAVFVGRVPGSNPVLDVPMAGAGWVVDPLLQSGDAGVMPDLARLSTAADMAGVFYVHQDFANGTQREYDIRYARLDFTNSPPVIGAPTVAVANLPLDDGPGGPPVGGLVLPDAQSDDFGNLVLGYSAYVEAGHQGAPKDKGTIQVRRFQETGGSLVPLDSWEYVGPVRFNHQRRPMLAASRKDKKNTVSLAWMDVPPGSNSLVEVKHWELLFPSAAAGPVSDNDLQFPASGFRTTLPAVMHARRYRLCLATVHGPNHLIPVAWIPTERSGLVKVHFPSVDPTRMAVDVLEFGNLGSAGSRVTPMSYEAVGSTRPSAIFLEILRL